MLMQVTSLRHYTVHATDGDLGAVDDLFFDDQTWTARYIVVRTGGWLLTRRVLISPIAITSVAAGAKQIAAELTRDQIARSPSIDTDMPLSRQMELKYRDYFAWPLYWANTFLDAYETGRYPRLTAADTALNAGRTERREVPLPHPPQGDPHLRSARKVTGYAVMATDGPQGRLDDVLIDTDTWAVTGLVVRLDHAAHGRRVSVPRDVVADISWPMATVHVHASRDHLAAAPDAPTERAER